jgi:hypothetical protein
MKVFSIQLVHIKSHQDNKVDWEKLSFQAQLNTIADAEATAQRNIMDHPAAKVTQLQRAQLQIDDIDITRDSQQWILHSAGRIPLQDYYQKKWGWSIKIFNKISWKTQQKALQHFSAEDQTRILKFVHGWLPTQHRLHKEGLALSPHCKLCSALYEDNLHLVSCTHTEMIKIQDNITTYMLKSLHDHGNSELINIFELAFKEATLNKSWHPSLAHVSPEWKPGIRDQTEIGWIHILFGRFSTTIIKAMDEHYTAIPINHKKYNGERWAVQLIINIWSSILKLWKKRNDIIYDTQNQACQSANHQKLTMRVQRCYSLQHQLKATERRTWFEATLEEKLQEELGHLQTWLQMVERLLRISKREIRKRPRSSVIMERFLGIAPNTTSTNPLQLEPSLNPRAYPQDLHPD